MLELSSNDPIIKAYLKDIQRLKDQLVIHDLGRRARFRKARLAICRDSAMSSVSTKHSSSNGSYRFPGYIVRLVGQVVRVSVETVRIVEAPPNFR